MLSILMMLKKKIKKKKISLISNIGEVPQMMGSSVDRALEVAGSSPAPSFFCRGGWFNEK